VVANHVNFFIYYWHVAAKVAELKKRDYSITFKLDKTKSLLHFLLLLV